MTTPRPSPYQSKNFISFIVRDDPLDFEETLVWPHPYDPDELQWRLRNGEPTKADLLVAASYVAIYTHIFDLPQKVRNKRIEQIKKVSEQLFQEKLKKEGKQKS